MWHILREQFFNCIFFVGHNKNNIAWCDFSSTRTPEINGIFLFWFFFTILCIKLLYEVASVFLFISRTKDRKWHHVNNAYIYYFLSLNMITKCNSMLKHLLKILNAFCVFNFQKKRIYGFAVNVLNRYFCVVVVIIFENKQMKLQSTFRWINDICYCYLFSKITKRNQFCWYSLENTHKSINFLIRVFHVHINRERKRERNKNWNEWNK